MLQGTCQVQVGTGQFYQKEARSVADSLMNHVSASYNDPHGRICIDLRFDPSDPNHKDDPMQPTITLVLTPDEWEEVKTLVDWSIRGKE